MSLAAEGHTAPPAADPTATAPTAIAPVGVTTRIDPEPSNIGDVLEYQVVAAFPRGYSVNLPSVLSLEPLHLLETAESEPEPTGEGLRKTFTLRLQHFGVGEAQVPGFPLTYVTPEGQVETVEVPPKAFTVESLLANEAEPTRRGEDPPVSLPYPAEWAETILYAVAGTLLAMALLLPLLLRVLRRERRVPPPPPVPPHEVAYAALSELEHGDLLDRRQFQRFYLELTEVAKTYLQGRFGVDALDRTTEELRRELLRERKRIEPLDADEVVAFLHRCDLVKFARFEPAREEAEAALAEVRSMVHRSRPVVNPSASEGKAPSGAPA